MAPWRLPIRQICLTACQTFELHYVEVELDPADSGLYTLQVDQGL